MPIKFKDEYREAKAWAAGHVVLAVAAGAVIGFVVHMLMF